MEMMIIIQGVSTLFMVGLIWFVQIIHYPLFDMSDPERFETFAYEHSKRTSWVVIPPMLLELISALTISVLYSDQIPKFEWITGLLLLAIAWLSTFCLQVPCHHKLQKGYDQAIHHRLVRTNWIRTLAWTARGIIVTLWMVRL